MMCFSKKPGYVAIESPFLVVPPPCPASLNANLQEGEAELGVERVNESEGVSGDLPMLPAQKAHAANAVELTVCRFPTT